MVALENTIPQESSSVKENIPDTQNQARVTKEQDSAYMEAGNKYDAILIKRIVMGTYMPTDEELLRFDINGDGKVDEFEYIAINRILLGTA